MIRRIPSPRGSHPEACRLAGWVRRLRARVAPRSREASGTDLGVLRPLREELARCAGSHWRERSAARSFQIAAGGAPRGVRMVAQSIRAASWLNGCGPKTHAPRGAPLPLRSKRPRAGTRAGKPHASFSGGAKRRPENLRTRRRWLEPHPARDARVEPEHDARGEARSLLPSGEGAAVPAPSAFGLPTPPPSAAAPSQRAGPARSWRRRTRARRSSRPGW
jgi:hypothetical protein